MTIQRHDTGPRMSKAVVHGDTVYLAGIVADAPKGKSMGEQTKSILAQIDGFLAQAGTDKSKLLSANIWITDMAKFAEMNAVWDAWVSPGNTPARATVEAKLASPDYRGRDHGGRRTMSPAVPQHGILAIFNDCRAGREAEFEAWFQGEHLIERLAVPGFLFGRRHKAIAGTPGYFNFYMVETPEVLTSKPYLERLDNPTPMTRTIMSEVFVNMNRTVCRRTARRGVSAALSPSPPGSTRHRTRRRWRACWKNLSPTRRWPAAKYGWRSMPPACRCRWKKNCAAATRRLPAR